MDVVEQAVQAMALNSIIKSRTSLSRHLESDPRRSIDDDCGYPATENITPEEYRRMYDRLPEANRVVNIIPEECWKVMPRVYEDEDVDSETDFEAAWFELGKVLNGGSLYEDEECHPAWNYLKLLDMLSGVGSYGVMLLGLDDGKELYEPVDGVEEQNSNPAQYNSETKTFDYPDGPPNLSKPYRLVSNAKAGDRNILYLRAFDESLSFITRFESNPTSPRYGQPVEYLLEFVDPNNQGRSIGAPQRSIRAHWTRVIHVADNPLSSQVFGVPRQQPVWNRLMDLRKLYGGSAEMYWRGAFPGISFETHPQLGGDVEIDYDALEGQIEEYMNSLQRYLTTSGMVAKPLSPQVVDPTPQINAHVKAICIQIGVPQRVFEGSERGELASSQDKDTWEERLVGRRNNHATPKVIKPFVDRCITIGVLPSPKQYRITWEQQTEVDPMTQAEVGAKQTEALAKYVGGNVEAMIPPQDYLTRVLGFDEDEADSILKGAMETEDEDRLTAEAAPEPEEEPGNSEEDGKKEEGDKPKPPFPQEPNGTKKDQTENYSPGQPRDSQGRWSSGGGGGGGAMAPDMGGSYGGSGGSEKETLDGLDTEKFEFVAQLDGSTNPELYEAPPYQGGQKYVVKSHDDKGFLQNEADADAAYRAIGIETPVSGMSKQGEKVSEFIEGGQTLRDWKKGKSQEDIDEMHRQISDGFVADAVLGNWDVVGLDNDNILIKDGEPIRIDNGGALAYRAQGKQKKGMFDSSVDELETMRNPKVNKQSAEVFGNLTEENIQAQMMEVANKRDKVLAQIKDPHTRKVLSQRFDSLDKRIEANDKKGVMPEGTMLTKFKSKQMAKKKKAKPTKKKAPSKKAKPKPKPDTTTKPKEVSAGVAKAAASGGDLASGAGVAKHLSDNASKQKFTGLQLAQLEAMNPKGIVDGKLAIPASLKANKKKLAQLHAKLPKGTKVEVNGNKKFMKGNLPKETKDKYNVKVVGKGKVAGKGKAAGKVAGKGKGKGKGEYSKGETLHLKRKGAVEGGAMAEARWYEQRLSPEEQYAIGDWKEEARYIRKDYVDSGGDPSKMSTEAKNFVSALKKAPSYSGELYRGVSGDYATDQMARIESTGIGGEWWDDSPMGTSKYPGIGSDFSRGELLLRVKTKKKKSNLRSIEEGPGGFLDDEAEVVALPGTRYRITGIRKSVDIPDPESSYNNNKVEYVKMLVDLEEI